MSGNASEETVVQPVRKLLNGAQRNALWVNLRLLEERADEIEAAVRAPTRQGTLYDMENDLTEAQRIEALQILGAIRASIRAIARQFNLERRHDSLSARLSAFAATSHTSLQDQKAVKLRRYGPVHPDVSRELDPALDRLLDHLDRLARLVRVGGEDSAAGQNTPA